MLRQSSSCLQTWHSNVLDGDQKGQSFLLEVLSWTWLQISIMFPSTQPAREQVEVRERG